MYILSFTPRPLCLSRVRYLVCGLLLSATLSSSAETGDINTSRTAFSNDQQVDSILMPTVESLLNNVVNASRYYSYKGLLTYEANGSLSTLSLYQWIDYDGEDRRVYQTLAFLDGAKRQVIREQGLTVCDSGQTRWGLWPSRFNVDALKAFYEVSIRASDRVADRSTYVINLVPKDKFRYGYQFDIDQETGLLLRSVIVEQETIIERTQFISINLQNEHHYLSANDSSAISWRVPEVEPCHTEQFKSAWFVSWLPEGFEPVGNRVTAQGEQALMFSDGLVSVSVFITSNQYKNIPKITAQRGATIAVMTPLSFDNAKTVAVVGEVPVVTARRIAVSVKAR
jgi:sigma-E factor negative regulatory protein RseB